MKCQFLLEMGSASWFSFLTAALTWTSEFSYPCEMRVIYSRVAASELDKGPVVTGSKELCG